MIKTIVFDENKKPSLEEKGNIIQFLFDNLQEYGDPKSDIEKCANYALHETPSFGGFILVSYLNDEISGAVIVNQTGMIDYIPENILVYIATSKNHRGEGIGKELIQKTINLTHGNIALHVEPDNPAKYLYEKFGFTNKYLEMRYKRNK